MSCTNNFIKEQSPIMNTNEIKKRRAYQDKVIKAKNEDMMSKENKEQTSPEENKFKFEGDSLIEERNSSNDSLEIVQNLKLEVQSTYEEELTPEFYLGLDTTNAILRSVIRHYEKIGKEDESPLKEDFPEEPKKEETNEEGNSLEESPFTPIKNMELEDATEYSAKSIKATETNIIIANMILDELLQHKEFALTKKNASM
ncbi:MAG: hypothetical protein MJ252_28505 [archaeon]|nr:hypothetical protein [archaeon]